MFQLWILAKGEVIFKLAKKAQTMYSQHTSCIASYSPQIITIFSVIIFI